MTTFFTSDTHFGHKRIIEYSGRPYDSIEQHDEALIENWNRVVGKDDTVMHLGDLSFLPRPATEDILSRLNGRIELVPGNHDYYKRKQAGREVPIADWFWHDHGLVRPLRYIVGLACGRRCELVHNVEHARGLTNVILCGHVHEAWPTQEVRRGDQQSLAINVGVDQWNYTPVSEQQIYDLANRLGYWS